MHELSNHIARATYFPPLPADPTPPPDDILDSLIEALRATVAHPDQAVQALAADTLDRLRRIQETARRNVAAERRGLMAMRLALIIQSVESHFRFERGTLLGRRRTHRIAMVRQLAMFVCRSLTSASYPQIARAFGRDHSTAIHNCDLIRARLVHDSVFRSFVQRLECQIIGIPITTTATAA